MRRRTSELSVLCLLAICVVLLSSVGYAQTERHPPIQRRVMAFYYPWYGTTDGPGGAGRTVHWGRIDAARKDIAASTHYPALGAYDSHDPDLIEKHCRWAVAAGVDTFIVSWWGHGEYADRAMTKILDACGRHGMKACIYYETVPRPQTADSAAADIGKVLERYGGHQAYLKADGSPVVFIYGRAVNELGLAGWWQAVQTIKAGHKGGVTAIGDQFSYGSARVFDGVHTYNTAGSLRGLAPAEVETWASETYRSWVELADGAGKISTITVIPGYDDTKIRAPGLAVERYDGRSYRIQWEQAIAADPHWVLITSFNEWHEGSEIEPSAEYGDKYIELTARYAARFKSTPRADRVGRQAQGVPEAAQEKLRRKLQRTRIGVLPEPESMAFWWLLDAGVEVQLLTWEDVVTNLTAERYPMLLYCCGEHYRRSAHASGDVDAALERYLRQGGFLVVIPSKPWPFYYDENGEAVNQSRRFGLTLRMGWEEPPADARLQFVQPERRLPHVPSRFDFPTSGDLRWRAFFAPAPQDSVSLLRLQNGAGENLGDAIAYARLPDGGRVAYAWFELFNGPHAEPLLCDLLNFVAERVE